MTRQYQGRTSVTGTKDGVEFKLGETIRVRGAVPRLNRQFQEYLILGTGSEVSAKVTLCTPTSNKFQVGGPKTQ